MMKTISLDRQIIPMMLFSYPILLLTVRGGMNGLFFLLAAISLIFVFSKNSRCDVRDSDARLFGLAMASYAAAIFLSQLVHQDFKFQPFDSASRFLLAIPVYLMLRQLRPATAIQYGFPLGAIAAFLVIWFYPHDWGSHRLGSKYVNPIHFGDLALVLGFLSGFSINWLRKDRMPTLLLKIAGLCAGLGVSILTGVRGGWVAIPLLLLIWLKFSGKSMTRIALALLALLLIGISGYFWVDIIHQRVDGVFQDLAVFSHGNRDTSTGERLQIWNVAAHLFAQNPLFGVGPDGFRQLMPELARAGMITPTAAAMGAAEVHNEILAKSVALGIFGLVSILSIHLVPLFLFIRSARTDSRLKRGAALLGIAVVAAFLIFGLTVEIFSLKMTATFYSLTVAVLLAIATHSESNVDSATNLFGSR